MQPPFIRLSMTSAVDHFILLQHSPLCAAHKIQHYAALCLSYFNWDQATSCSRITFQFVQASSYNFPIANHMVRHPRCVFIN